MADRAVVGILLLLLTAGCTAAVPAPAPVDPARVVRATIDAVNATAGGDVAAQQQVLRRIVDPARTAEQDACAPATITVRIDAVLDRLAPAPPASAATATASTAEATDRYRLPVLLEVYTDGLRTGTDLAGLDVVLIDGTAYTGPLCLR